MPVPQKNKKTWGRFPEYLIKTSGGLIFLIMKKNKQKQQGLTPLQLAGLRRLSDIYVMYFSPFIENGTSPTLMSTNGQELLQNLSMCNLSYERFFHSVEKRIEREFDNVKEARFDYKYFLLSGVYCLNLTYVSEERAAA